MLLNPAFNDLRVALLRELSGLEFLALSEESAIQLMEGVFWAILERLVLDIARHFLLVVPVARVSGASWWLLCVLDVVISFRLCPSC